MEEKSIEKLVSLLKEYEKNNKKLHDKARKDFLKDIKDINDKIMRHQMASAQKIRRLEQTIVQQGSEIQQLKSRITSLQNKSRSWG